MSSRIIHSSLRQQFALIPTYPKAYQGVSFTPTGGVLYLKETFVPVETFQVGLADDSVDKFRGIYQIMVVAPLDKGMGATYQAIDVIQSYFYRGLLLEGVRIDKAYTANSIVEGAWMYTPVTITYTALL